MRVLLLSCYELGHQPLSLGTPAGALAGAGHEVTTSDLAVDRLQEDQVRSADLVAISVPMHTALRLGVRVAARVRAIHPNCRLVFYGLYAELNRDVLRAAGADDVLGDAPQAELVALVESLERGVPLAQKKTIDWQRQPTLFPPLRTGLPPLGRYARAIIDGEERLAAAVETTRGCLHHCRHCPIPAVYGGRFVAVPLAEVMADLAAVVALGARHITFADADFLNGPRHAVAVVEALHDQFPQVTFDFTAKVEHLLRDRALLPQFAARGCKFVVSAVESLSDIVLDHLQKGHSRADVFAALALVREAQIAWRPSLLAFTPWTCGGDYLDLLDWVDQEALWDHLDPVQWTIRLLVPPGSLLLETEAMRPHLGPLDPDRFSYAWTHPDPRMDALACAVTAVVEKSVAAGEPAQQVVARIRLEAEKILGEHRPAVALHAPLPSGPVPRLTEPWFCCAEPTRRQMEEADG